MKFLKTKYIVSSLILICVGVLLGLYFIGGLKYASASYDNIEFDLDGFKDYSTYIYDENGNKTENQNIKYDNNKVVAENDKYALILDEETTIANIIDKNDNNKVLFQTAQDAEDSNGANLKLNYAKVSNGKTVNVQLNSLQHSVKFENTLTGELESYYKIKYVEDGVQILYEIGKFSANIDYFPRMFPVADFASETIEDFNGEKLAFKENLKSLEGRFQGNTFFSYELTDDVIDGKKVQILEYDYKGFTYSPAAKDYLVENGLATAEERTGYWSLSNIDPILYDSYGTHLNSPISPVYTNPFFSTQEFNTIKNGGYRRAFPNEVNDFHYYDRDVSGSSAQKHLYSMLYESHQQMDISTLKIPVYDIEGNPVMRGGFHAVDENGNFLYDENGNPVQKLYSLEQVAIDNAVFDIESPTTLERFQVCLQLKLKDNGLEAVILGDSLQDYDAGQKDENYDHDFLLNSIVVMPELTTSRDTNAEGMMVIPDGSGSFINFNNGKAALNYSGYNKEIYGRDMAFVLREQPTESQKIMFNMYGFIDNTENKGIMAVVEKGAGQSSIFADTPRGINQSNSIYFISNVRKNEMVTAGTGYNTSKFPKWSKNMSKSDLVYQYVFLDESRLNYVGLANEYREYLIDRYDLEFKDNTTENVVNLDLIGAFERYALFLGIKYMKDDSLTTFSEAQRIVRELLDNGVNNINIGYTSWTKDEMEPKTRRNIKPSKVLGGKSGMMALHEFLQENDIDFYPELNVTSSTGYKYPFGNIKYTSRGVGNDYAKHHPYNLATLLEDRTKSPVYYLSPHYYQSLIQKMLPSYSKLNINSAYVADLGNEKIGNYKENIEVYGYGAQLFQMNALETLQKSVGKLKLSAPFDYALPYADFVVDVPLESSKYGIFDGEIPFYQLVINGLVDYSTEYISGISDKSADWYFAKALVSGSNLNFQVSYTDPVILLETDYTQFYKAYYQNWRDEIIEMNELINDTGIHNGQLVDHVIVERDLHKVTYRSTENEDVVLIVNTSNKNYEYNGITISAYGYIKEGGE